MAKAKKRKWLRVVAVIFVLSLFYQGKDAEPASVPQDSASSAISTSIEKPSVKANKYSADGCPTKPWEDVMFGTIYSTSKYGDIEKFKAGEDIPAGTYVFCRIPTTCKTWVAIQKRGIIGEGGGSTDWGIIPVREGQTLLAEGAAFCLIDECDESAMPSDVPVYEGLEGIGYSSVPQENRVPERYLSAMRAAELLREQYPDISWSSLWEELYNKGYSYDEIAWAIGG